MEGAIPVDVSAATRQIGSLSPDSIRTTLDSITAFNNEEAALAAVGLRGGETVFLPDNNWATVRINGNPVLVPLHMEKARELECVGCGNCYANLCDLKQHYAVSHLGLRLRCRRCPFTAKFASCLSKHRTTAHPAEPASPTEHHPPTLTTPPLVISDNADQGGTVVVRTYTDPGGSAQNIPVPVFLDPARSGECTRCGRMYTKAINMRRHYMAKHLKIMFPCTYCGTFFQTYSKVGTHQSSCPSTPFPIHVAAPQRPSS